MNRLKEKLNSDRGASITWALLIFLVCTVVGSAVLVAGTTAAGRMSKLPENDERYYAVTSVANLLRDALKQNFEVKRTATSGLDGLPLYQIEYESADILEKAIIQKLMGWPDSSPTESTFKQDGISLASEITVNDISITATQVSGALANVKCSLTLGTDGSILAVISKADPPKGSPPPAASKNEFAVQMLFELDRTITDLNGVKTDTFKWTLKEARTVLSKDK